MAVPADSPLAPSMVNAKCPPQTAFVFFFVFFVDATSAAVIADGVPSASGVRARGLPFFVASLV